MNQTLKFVIRPTEYKDIPSIQSIYAHEVENGTSSFELIAPSIKEMESRYARALKGGYSHLVACTKNEIIGYAYTGSYRPRPAYRFSIEDSIYVKPDYRSLGIASDLLKALIEDCEDKPFRQMIAIIGDSANIASINLHRKHGFREVGVLKDIGYKFDQWVDTVIMQKSLKQTTE